MLACASLPDVWCIYMRAKDVLAGNGGDLFEWPKEKRNDKLKELLIKALKDMHPGFEYPLLTCPRTPKQRAVIMVDDAGPYPNLVCSMCSTAGLEMTLTDDTEMSLGKYLCANHVQLVVATTTVGVEYESEWRSWPFIMFSAHPMRWYGFKYHRDNLVAHEMPWLAKVLSRDAARDVRKQMDEANQNPRMHACVVSKLTKDPDSIFASDDFKKEARKLFMDHDDSEALPVVDIAERQCAMEASILTELERCLRGAKKMFEELKREENVPGAET